MPVREEQRAEPPAEFDLLQHSVIFPQVQQTFSERAVQQSES